MADLIRLHCGLTVSVSAEDAERLSARRWHALRNGKLTYARSSIKAGNRFRTVLMHRLILGAEPGEQVDHIDGDGLNNRRSNLRIATPMQNARNKAGRGLSAFAGVRRAGDKWKSTISPAGLEIHLGLFDTEAEAAGVYNAAARRVYGEFARLNPVPDLEQPYFQLIAETGARIAELQRVLAVLKGIEQ